MKREFLENLGLEKEVIDKIMTENGADMEREKARTNQAKADLADVQSKLAERDKDLEELRKTAGDADASKKQLEELQAKYNAETEQYKSQIADRDYSDATEYEIVNNNVKFTSKSAKEAFVAGLKANRLPMKDKGLEGFADYLKAQKESDPEAFQSDKPSPRFVTPSGGGSPQSFGSTAEQAAKLIGKSAAESGKTANNIIAMYTGGKN